MLKTNLKTNERYDFLLHGHEEDENGTITSKWDAECSGEYNGKNLIVDDVWYDVETDSFELEPVDGYFYREYITKNGGKRVEEVNLCTIVRHYDA